ncbi:flavin reductase family protein [Agrobacterium sp. NPDC089420]|uniref:flavin reductase family protein n=1 Tax=Agrobacterium sp. NPDC089420 TaxID=3363918 RepID=UPI00384E2D89
MAAAEKSVAPGDTIDPRHFRTVLGSFPTGVVAITSTEADEQPVGMIVGSFTSVSLKPPLVSFLADHTSTSQARIRATGRFCANVLAADQERLCRKLAGRGTQKFDGVAWQASPLGNPVLEGIVSWIDCTIEDTIEIGDHYLIVGRVRELTSVSDKTPLLFLRGGYGDYFSNSALLLERLREWP